MKKQTFMRREFAYAGALPQLHFPVFRQDTIPCLTKAQMDKIEEMYWKKWDEAFFSAIFVMDRKNEKFAHKKEGFLDKHVTSEGPSLGVVLVIPEP